MSEQTNEVVVRELTLDQLAVGDNIRYSLKPLRVEQLARSIQEHKRIHTPLKVEPDGDGKFVVREGNYRRAAAEWLAKKGEVYPIPCIVEPVSNPLDRMLKQLSENNDRENMTAMDISKAIVSLRQAGMERIKIRELFAKPNGKGKLTITPLSGSMYSYYLRFQELPKPVQEGLHNGTIPVSAGARLLDAPPDARKSILEAAEKERLQEIAREESADERLMKAEKAEADERDLKDKAEKLVAERQKAEEQLKADFSAKKRERVELMKALPPKEDPKRAEAVKAVHAAEAAEKAAGLKHEAAARASDEAAERLKRYNKTVEQKGRKLEEERKAAIKKQAVKGAHVAAAAQQAKGVGRVPCNPTQMRKYLKDWAAATGSFPKVARISRIIIRAFDSELTDGQALREMGVITGDVKALPAGKLPAGRR